MEVLLAEDAQGLLNKDVDRNWANNFGALQFSLAVQ